MAESKKAGYRSKPLWFWILVYLVVGGIVYYLIYYFVLAKKGYNYQYPTGDTQQNQLYK